MKMKMFVAVFALAAMAAPMAGSQQASAQSSRCYGDYCSNRDPNMTIGPSGRACAADGRVLQTVYGVPGSADPNLRSQQTRMMWSDSCQANWISTIGPMKPASIVARQNTGYTVSGVLPGGSEWHSPMIYSPVRAVYGYAYFAPIGSAVTNWF
jgi:hypothetical protein